jgi:hypothetical protein
MLSGRADGETKYPGLYVGRVKQVQVEGQAPGCIQVSIPTIFGDDNPEFFQIARPCFPYGHFFVPKVEDEVWLAFEHGDPTSPVWLGVWYTQSSAPEPTDPTSQEPGVIETKPAHPIVLEISDERIQIKSKGRIAIDATSLTLCGRLVDPTVKRTI